MPRAVSWLAVLAALAALAGQGCGGSEPRTLRVTLRLDPAMPAFDWVQFGVASMRDGSEFLVEGFQLFPADFDADGRYSTILFIANTADLVEAQADVHAGAYVVGHGRRSVSTFERQDYELEVPLVPTPAY